MSKYFLWNMAKNETAEITSVSTGSAGYNSSGHFTVSMPTSSLQGRQVANMLHVSSWMDPARMKTSS